MSTTKNWFKTWFNTSYYHILYQNRNDEEAQFFIKNITSFLKIKQGDTLLDLGCGKGRHAVFLNSLGFKVTGADLSSNSIAHAKQFENEHLRFLEHDMRDPFTSKFDVIFNLFTSFGFFEDDKEDILVLTNIKNGLKQQGTAVIDFMNAHKVIANIVPKETVTRGNITFHIKRRFENGFIIKDISFRADNQDHHYTERVKCLNYEKIEKFLKQAGLHIVNAFGDYDLSDFNPDKSNRLILVVA
ncbi:MAG: class I SAM-dependent methyltransferase [Flavobacteriaceae bacterium]|nr:class I SAM-dependent methyltransferase [Flavobacteriaceae bacterium]